MTILDPQRQQKYELEVHKKIWRAALYARDRFQSELLDLYLQALPHYDNRPLPKEYLAAVIRTIGDIYADEFPPELPEQDRPRHLRKIENPSETYAGFLKASVQALVGFTRAFPREACRPLADKTVPLFETPLQVFTEDEDFTPQLKQACRELTQPFTLPPLANYLNTSDFYPMAWFEFSQSKPYFRPEEFYESEPGDPESRRWWRDRKRQHDRDVRRAKHNFNEYDVASWQDNKRHHDRMHKKVHEETLPWETTFHGSPFFYHSSALIPDKLTVPFDIPAKRWFEGTWIVGAQGRGKTNLLRHLILNLHEGNSVIILDAKGDLRRTFSRMAALKDRLIIIEPDLKNPPALNPLDVGANSTEFISYLFEALGTEMTPFQTTLFRALAPLLEVIPNATLEDLRTLLQDPEAWKSDRYLPFVRRLEPEDQLFFEKEFSTRVYNDRKPEILQRLRLLLSNKYLKAMFRSPVNKFKFDDFMNEGNVVLINNDYHPDTLGKEGCEFFGRAIISLVWAAARRRIRLPDSRKRPVFFFLDEAHYVISRDPTIGEIIQQCRAQKIAMVFAHQEVQQIKNEDVKSALTNCAIKFANSSGEAHELAPRLFTDPAHIASQKEGTFACFVLDQPPTVTLKVPLIPVRDDATLIDHPTIGDHEYHALMLTMKARYCMGVEAPSFPQYDLEWETTISPHVARDGGTRRIHGLDIKIRPGTKHGTRMRLKGKGALRPDGSSGDAFLTIWIAQNPNADKPRGKRHPWYLPNFKDDD